MARGILTKRHKGAWKTRLSCIVQNCRVWQLREKLEGTKESEDANKESVENGQASKAYYSCWSSLCCQVQTAPGKVG